LSGNKDKSKRTPHESRLLGQVLRGLTTKGERSGAPPWQSPIGKEIRVR